MRGPGRAAGVVESGAGGVDTGLVRSPVPLWYDRLVAALLSLGLGLGVFGLLAARLGVFVVALVVFPGAALAYTVYLGMMAGTTRRPGSARPAIAAVAFVTLWMLANGAVPGERIIADSEAAVPAHAALELARTGDLDVRPEPPFGADVRLDAPGWELVDGRWRPVDAGAHTALLGAAAWLGSGALYRTGVLLGGAALLAFYGLAARLLRPLPALAVTVALGVNAAFVLAARDVSPAPLLLAFVAGALALLREGDQQKVRTRAAAAGGLLGAAAIVDLDWMVLAIPVAAYVGILTTSRTGSWVARRRRIEYAGAMAIGYAAALVAAMALTLDDDSAVGVRALVVLLLAAAAGAAPLMFRRRTRWPIDRRVVAMGAAGFVVAAGLLAVLVRPVASEVTGPPSPQVAAAQAFEGDPIEPTRTYAEQSARWPGWYLGPVAPAAGLVGMALLAGGLIVRREPEWLALVLLAAVASIAWLWNPGEARVQPGAAARLVPVTFPALLLAAGWVADRLWDHQGRLREITETAAVALLVGVVALPLLITAPLVSAAAQVGALDSVDKLCAEVGVDSAVLVVADGADPVWSGLPFAIRHACEVPAAWTAPPSPEMLDALAERADGEGRELVVVLAAGARTLPRIAYTSPEPTVSGPPLGTVEVVVPLAADGP